MCLKTKSYNPQIAQEDIKCYKVLKYERYNKKYFTPFNGILVSDAIINGVANFWAKGEKNVLPSRYGKKKFSSYNVGGGFIHTYKEYDDKIKHQYRSYMWNEYAVFECIIPTGAIYYEGNDDNTQVKSYASNCIKFVKRIDIIDTPHEIPININFEQDVI